MNNPFELVTASKLTAAEATDLWCDDRRLDRVRGRETCFIHGNRGTGKSMLFRILQHDCQEILFPSAQPAFLSVYFPVRDSELMIEELDLIQSHRQISVLSESHLILLIIRQLFVVLRDNPAVVSGEHQEPFVQLLRERITNIFEFSDVDGPRFGGAQYGRVVDMMIEVVDRETTRLVSHISRQLLGAERGFDGPLFFFDGLLAPVADFFFDIVGRTLFFLIDDADDLPVSHTVVLNSWIARRRKSAVFKVSTMYAYKTYETRSGSKVQDPHDFIQYDIATRFIEYESEDYLDLLHRICKKRLSQTGSCDTTGQPIEPSAFFPEDVRQVEQIEELRSELSAEYRTKYSGRAIKDNVYRHLTSEYMQRLNRRRALASYRYAGFRTLAILSGGLVRDFIVSAQRMYDDAARKAEGGYVDHIPSRIQDAVIRQHADSILSEISDARKKRTGESREWREVDRLIRGLGAAFRRKMLSKESERRVFSFAFQSSPSRRLHDLLDLAVSEGYLVRGFIANKEGGGRRYLYVLSRRFAPAFSLDVSAYSGYLSLSPRLIETIVAGTAQGRWEDDVGQGELDFSAIGGPHGDQMVSEPDGREKW